MSRFTLTLTAGLSIGLLSACSQPNEPDIASPSSEAAATAKKAEATDEGSIVVTAQRRSEYRTDTPVAITAISLVVGRVSSPIASFAPS